MKSLKSILIQKFSTQKHQNVPSQAKEYLKLAGVLTGAVVGGTLAYSYLSDSRAGIYRILMPLMHKLEPEDAHYWSIQAAKYGLVPVEKNTDVNKNERLKVDVLK
jgi:hypothetical protein